MQKPVNVLDVALMKHVQKYNLESGEVGESVQEYLLFNKQVIISDLNPTTIKGKVVEILDKNYIPFDTVKKGWIFEDSRLTFQTYENAEGLTMEEESPYFVDNNIYIEVNQGDITIDELKEIFPEIEIY